ncbi:hypothetical protein CRENBAI_018046 [Crenichthys baileyi]|uniref:BHLH domain-containing protein n=1 Tax=Crenichthys baileyi TaxID=28760 RepID=A0AAV9S4A7_9TELE
MSTGSSPSDPEDDEIFNRRTSTNVRKTTHLNSRGIWGKGLEEGVGGTQRGPESPPRLTRRLRPLAKAPNARERARMRVLSKAFSRLKTSLPWVPADTKLSKLDTLRLASSYICHLREILQEDRLENSFAHPVSLAASLPEPPELTEK